MYTQPAGQSFAFFVKAALSTERRKGNAVSVFFGFFLTSQHILNVILTSRSSRDTYNVKIQILYQQILNLEVFELQPLQSI